MEIKDRIRMIMEREKVPPRVFAETIGVQQSTLSHILNDRNKPSLEVVMKVHQKYDYVNLEWLLYGKGEMVVSEEETSFSSSNSDYLPSLFDENLINSSKEPAIPENRKETPLRNAARCSSFPRATSEPSPSSIAPLLSRLCAPWRMPTLDARTRSANTASCGSPVSTRLRVCAAPITAVLSTALSWPVWT